MVSMLVSAVLSATALTDDVRGMQRYAVVVGSNSGIDGRPGLRFSHRDARAFAQVLFDVGHFARSNVDLLFDPTPQTVLDLLDLALRRAREDGGRAMLVFYYSGHADGKALYPDGHRLDLNDLKSRLNSDRGELRVGIIDGCRGVDLSPGDSERAVEEMKRAGIDVIASSRFA